MGFQAAGYVLLLGLMFGSSSVVSRFMLEQFDPITYTAARLLLAGVVFLAFYLFRVRGRRWPTDRLLWVRSILFGAIADTIPIVLIVSTLQYLSSGLTTTLTTLFPVVTVLLAHFLLPDETLNLRKSLGVFLATTGAVLIILLGETGLEVTGSSGLPGYLMIGAASAIFGASTIYARKFMMEYDTFDTVSIRMFAAALTAIVLAFFFEPKGVHGLDSLGIILLIYAAAIFFGGFLLGFYVLQRFGVMVSAMSNYIPPVVASILGMLFLAEKITPGMVVGMGMILVGVGVINLAERQFSRTKV